jgi:hypothetical protein
VRERLQIAATLGDLAAHRCQNRFVVFRERHLPAFLDRCEADMTALECVQCLFSSSRGSVAF